MRFLTVVGARPQFVKAAPLSAELRRQHREFLVHTGQHYDDNMSAVFFRELQVPPPDRNLGVGSGPQGRQTAVMLQGLEEVLMEIRPDAVIVYGDTNSTLAGALAAVKLHIPVAHVEAGLRSFNRAMPEEINRILTDQVSQWLFIPSPVAREQLAAEGIHRGVYEVGDIMADCVRRFGALARSQSTILDRLGLRPGEYCVATVHRASNTDDCRALRGIVEGLRRLECPVILPLHPRTQAAIRRHAIDLPLPGDGCPDRRPGDGLLPIEPLGYLDMLQLQQHAALVLTDSGGMQKEAYYLGVRCITLREETEWVETVEAGWNHLAGADPDRIAAAVGEFRGSATPLHPPLYGDGHAAERIVEVFGDRCCATDPCAW